MQRRLAPMVSRTSEIQEPTRYIAGVYISGVDLQGEALASVVVLSYPSMEVAEVQVARQRPNFPYVPGLLSFRETPLLMQALEMLTLSPDIIVVDGHGLAHPRRFGIACHIGLLYGVPTIGCAKSILVGKHGPLGMKAGAWAELVHHEEVVGAALRTQDGKAPVYVSIGHQVDLPAAIQWALACTGGHRIPEPTRLAHQAAAGRTERLRHAAAASQGEPLS